MDMLKKITLIAAFLAPASVSAATLTATGIISGTNNTIGGPVTVNETFIDSSPATSTAGVSISQSASFKGVGQTGTTLGSINADGTNDGFFNISTFGQGNHLIESRFQYSQLITNTTATAESLAMDFLISAGKLSTIAYETAQQGSEFLQAEYGVSISFGGVELFQSGAVLRQTAGPNLATSSPNLTQTGTSFGGTYTPGSVFGFDNEAIYSWGDYNGTLLLGLLNSGESRLLEYDVFVRGTSQFDMCGSSGCGATKASIGDPFTLSSNISPSNISIVPVPAAVWLFGSGLMFIAGFARRKVTA